MAGSIKRIFRNRMETFFKIMKKDFIHKKECRICGSSNLVKTLDLGSMPPANSFLKKRELKKTEKKFPLVVYFCEDCKLLQLLDVVNPEILFGHYSYLTSASKPLADHFIEMGRNLAKRFIVSKNDLIIEIGGNDAVLLESIKDKCRVLNIEPAQNLAEVSRQKGVETINDFFNKNNLADKIFEKYGSAKLIIANNVMAHIDDVKSVFAGIKTLIGDDGVFVFEAHWVGNLINQGGFDQIYHEHLCYFSLIAIKNLVERFNFKIFDVQLVPIHGQSLRVYVGNKFKVCDSVKKFLNKEKKIGLNKAEIFLEFSERVRKNKKKLVNLLEQLKKTKKIIGYGAPAKGNTLLNFFGINAGILDFLIDSTSLKQKTYTPGTHIPVVFPEKLKEVKPDYILLLAWNYENAILEKEKDLRESGVKFIIPVPNVRIV